MANKNVTCRVRLYKPAIRNLTNAVSEALGKTAEEIRKDVQQAQTMPFLTGDLQGDYTFADLTQKKEGHASVVSDRPYARRLYYHPEYHFDKSENPNAGGRWLDPYLPGGKKEDFAQKTFNKFYKEEAGL